MRQSVNAEIVAVDDVKNTYQIKLHTPGANGESTVIELDQSYLANCIVNPDESPQAPPSDTFFADNDISASKVTQLWTQILTKFSHHISDNNDSNMSDTMALESSQECDAFSPRECPITQRLCFIQQFYRLWIEHNLNTYEAQDYEGSDQKHNATFASITDLFDTLEGYSYKQLLNDFHHLKQFHLNCTNNHESTSSYFRRRYSYFRKETQATDDIYSYFRRRCVHRHSSSIHNPTCEDTKCRSFARNTRDRQKCGNRGYRHKLYFIRNAANRTVKSGSAPLQPTEMGEVHEITAQELLDTVHSSLMHGDDMSLSDKFVTHFEDESPEKKEEKETTACPGCPEYGFGIAYKYTEKAKQSAYYCPTKYDSLKYELLHNTVYTLDEFAFTALYRKAEQFLLSWNGKQIWKAKQMGRWNVDYGIEAHSLATVSHILVIMSYTNYDRLQNHFKKTYRKLHPEEDRKEMTVRHSEIANWARLLDEAVTFFSERLIEDDVEFYHGINCQLIFPEFQALFLCPTSTTTDPSIAYNFASDKGVVLALGKADSRGPVFMNVSFLSDYPQEEERLIMSNYWAFANIIYNGMSTKYYVKCLKLFEKIVNGSFVAHNKKLFRVKYQKRLIRMMDECMGDDSEKQSKIPAYLQRLFNHLCHQIETIYINSAEFAVYFEPLQKYLVGTTAPATPSKSGSIKSKFGKSKNKTKDGPLQCGVFAQYLKIKIQNVSHFKWTIEGSAMDSFWKGKHIKGKKIECDISHLIERKVNKNKFIFIPGCRQHTINTKDGRFCYGLELNKYPSFVQSFTFRFEVCIPEINFYDAETMHSQGRGAFGDNRFESVQLNNHKTFTIHFIISIRSLS